MQSVIMAILLVVGMASSAFFYREGREAGFGARDAQYQSELKTKNEAIEALNTRLGIHANLANKEREEAVAKAVKQ